MRAKHKFEFGLAIYFDNFRKCKFEFNFSGNYHRLLCIKLRVTTILIMEIYAYYSILVLYKLLRKLFFFARKSDIKIQFECYKC